MANGRKLLQKGREVQQREENDGKEEKTMVERKAQCNGRTEKAMEREKNLKEQCQRGENDGTGEQSTT